MKEKFRRVFSLMMALIIVFTMMPSTAFAASSWTLNGQSYSRLPGGSYKAFAIARGYTIITRNN